MSSTQTATEPTISTFEDIQAIAEKQSKFVKVQPGQTVVLKFLKTADGKQRMVAIDKEYEGRKSKAVRYDVLNINDGQEKVIELAISWALNLNAILKEGFDVIKVTRTGSGLGTSYGFAPTK